MLRTVSLARRRTCAVIIYLPALAIPNQPSLPTGEHVAGVLSPCSRTNRSALPISVRWNDWSICLLCRSVAIFLSLLIADHRGPCSIPKIHSRGTPRSILFCRVIDKYPYRVPTARPYAADFAFTTRLVNRAVIATDFSRYVAPPPPISKTPASPYNHAITFLSRPHAGHSLPHAGVFVPLRLRCPPKSNRPIASNAASDNSPTISKSCCVLVSFKENTRWDSC